jgi:Holliday junction resolvase RusA-like endonuclease
VGVPESDRSLGLSFWVPGIPAAQGSMRAFRLPNGRVTMTDMKGDKLKLWRHAINDEARRVAGQIIEGPVAMRVEFRLLKPKSAPKRRRTWPIGKLSGDLDKLARAVGDALTGVLFVDDCQVVEWSVSKDYGDNPGAMITVIEIVEDSVEQTG